MSKFAKLYDLGDDNQILVTQTVDDNDTPQLSFTTNIPAGEITTSLVFSEKDDDTDYSIDLAWERCDAALASMTADMAVGVINGVLEMLQQPKFTVPAS